MAYYLPLNKKKDCISEDNVWYLQGDLDTGEQILKITKIWQTDNHSTKEQLRSHTSLIPEQDTRYSLRKYNKQRSHTNLNRTVMGKFFQREITVNVRCPSTHVVVYLMKNCHRDLECHEVTRAYRNKMCMKLCAVDTHEEKIYHQL